MPNTKRQSKRFEIPNIDQFIDKTCHLGDKQDFFIRLENHQIAYPQNSFPKLIAFGSKSSISLPQSKNAFKQLSDYYSKTNDWAFGYFSYDLKNDTENLKSENIDLKQFPELCFFCPEHIVEIEDNSIRISSILDPEVLFEQISNQQIKKQPVQNTNIQFESHLSKKEYLNVINKLRNHIYEGDIYEINYCMEYIAEAKNLDTYQTWVNLCKQSPTPFSAYFKTENSAVICSSPERFIKGTSSKIISQPIKGTIETGNSKIEKQINKNRLLNSEKERAENMMIVDLVRNDLAKSSVPGSVKVEELFGIYEFRHLYHMISTVVSEKKLKIGPIEIIKNAFPMGSMTGAPKIKVMELIEEYETTKRGIFSGSIGYINPEGDFDFNVIIRSLFYNSGTNKLSYNVGSAITYDSDPQYEFEECQLKAKAIREIFAK